MRTELPDAVDEACHSTLQLCRVSVYIQYIAIVYTNVHYLKNILEMNGPIEIALWMILLYAQWTQTGMDTDPASSRAPSKRDRLGWGPAGVDEARLKQCAQIRESLCKAQAKRSYSRPEPPGGDPLGQLRNPEQGLGDLFSA